MKGPITLLVDRTDADQCRKTAQPLGSDPRHFAEIPVSNPFDLDDDNAYRRWKERKLAAAPTALTDLVVEIGDPRALSDAEHAAILERCRRANMAIYIGTTGDDPDKAIPVALGARFGLHRLDHNRGADEDAVTSLTVQTDAAHRNYIPYSDRPIAWHTDGYYNTPEQQIHGLPAITTASAGPDGRRRQPLRLSARSRRHRGGDLRRDSG